MTRKDYKIISEAFALFNYMHQPTRHYIAHALADRLEQDNPRFRRDLFIEACDLTSLERPTVLIGNRIAGKLDKTA